MLTVFETCSLDMKKAKISHEGEAASVGCILPRMVVLKMAGKPGVGADMHPPGGPGGLGAILTAEELRPSQV